MADPTLLPEPPPIPHSVLPEPPPVPYPLLPEPPLVPRYDATQQEVEDFLKEYFKSQLDRSDTASLEMAQRFPFNGPTLFQASEEKLFAIYSFIGTPLFNYLQESKYGRVCPISCILFYRFFLISIA